MKKFCFYICKDCKNVISIRCDSIKSKITPYCRSCSAKRNSRIANIVRVGMTHTDETKKKMKISWKKRLDDGYTGPNLGKTFSKEWRKNISKGLIGNQGYWSGKKRSDETKQKISKNRKGKCKGLD